MMHPFGGYCEAREKIKSLESKLTRYEEALKSIAKCPFYSPAFEAKAALDEVEKLK